MSAQSLLVSSATASRKARCRPSGTDSRIESTRASSSSSPPPSATARKMKCRGPCLARPMPSTTTYASTSSE
eukprot:2725761-Lingulodinium_polyedra.AAC.1